MATPPFALETYLQKPDPAAALVSLVGEVAARLSLPARVEEIGVVCTDVRAAAERLEKGFPGMKPFLLGGGSPARFLEDGKETPFMTRVGFGFYKGMIIELAEPGTGSGIFAQPPVAEGEILINHLGFAARGPDLARTDGGVTRRYADVMQKAGYARRYEAVLNVLGVVGHIHIFDTEEDANGLKVEFLDFRLFSENGLKIPYPAWLVGVLGWLQAHVGPRFLTLGSTKQLPPTK
jgi:hypothetical protein